MDFMTVLTYIAAIVETAALAGALIFATRAMHENKLKKTQKGKKGAKSGEEIDKAIAVYKRYAGIFIFVYLVLNVIRNYSRIFK